MEIILIAAIGQRNELGIDGDLIWHMPGDLLRVKELTMGHPVIMGRKTYESFPQKHRPLVGRTNIVLTRKNTCIEKTQCEQNNLIWVDSVQQALKEAAQSDGSQKCYIFGGAEIYRAFLPYVTTLELTMIEARKPGADTYLPQWEKKDFEETFRESYMDHDPQYHFVRYEKKVS